MSPTDTALVALPGGDPTLAGWLITIGYALVSILCVLAARTTLRGGHLDVGAARRRKVAAFWFTLSAACLILAVNKQLDLHSGATSFASGMARRQGWYHHRRAVQAVFVGVLFLLFVGSLAASFRVLRDLPRACRLALVGVACAVGFGLLRAAQFHHVTDRVSALRPALGVAGFALEAAGGGIIGYAAWLARGGAGPADSPSSPA